MGMARGDWVDPEYSSLKMEETTKAEKGRWI
jgi:hypothetical protein